MIPKHPLAVLGLAIEAIGVLMFFKWGPPQPDFQEYVGISVEDATVLSDGRTAAEHGKEARELRARYKRMAGIALGLVFIGLILQLIDSWIFD